MKNMMLHLLLAALCSAAPPLQLEERAVTPPPLLLEEEVLLISEPIVPEVQTPEKPKVTVIPRLEFEEITLSSPTETPVEELATVAPVPTTTKMLTWKA